MLSIKRHFSISKLSITTGLRASGDYIAHVWQSFVGGLRALTNRREHLGRDSLISVLVVLIGFFGTVAALVGLHPTSNQNVARGPASGQQANGETGHGVTSTPPANQAPSGAAPSPHVAESPTSPANQPTTFSQPATSPVVTVNPTSTAPLSTPQIVQPAATPVAPTPTPVVPPTSAEVPPADTSGSGSTTITTTTITNTLQGVTAPVDSLLPR